VAVRIEVCSIRAVRLKRQDAAGSYIFSAEQSLKGFQYRGIGGLGQQTQQCALALEQAAQHSRDGKGPVTVRNGGEDLARKFFGKKDGALRLAAGAEIPCPARERQKMLLAAFVTANSGETSLKPPTGQEIFYRANDHRAQRPRLRLEALFVSPDVTVKVSFKQLIESRTLGMPGTVLGRGFRNNPARCILIYAKTCFGCLQTRGDRLKVEEHGSCGLRAAIDLIAGATFELKHLWAETAATELTPHAKLDKLSPE
jgi:hypothetical protein